MALVHEMTIAEIYHSAEGIIFYSYTHAMNGKNAWDPNVYRYDKCKQKIVNVQRLLSVTLYAF